MTELELCKLAMEQTKKAYTPYSHFRVGAALIAKNDSGEKRVFSGCNIENASYSPTMCAERVAIAEAVKNGFLHIEKLAVCGGPNGAITDYCPPCGVCRQVLSEFATKDTEIILYNGIDYNIYKMEDILPLSFKL